MEHELHHLALLIGNVGGNGGCRIAPPLAPQNPMLRRARLMQTSARGCIPTPLPDGNKIARLGVDRPLRKSILNIEFGGKGGRLVKDRVVV